MTWSTVFGVIKGYPAEVYGEWWLPGHREHAVHARLILDHEGRARLESETVVPREWYGSEIDDDSYWLSADAIHGVAGIHLRPMSLLGCQIRLMGPGVSTLDADAAAVVDGLWVTSARDAAFGAAHVSIEHLRSWAGLRSIEVGLGTTAESRGGRLIAITGHKVDPLVATLDDGLTIRLKSFVRQSNRQTAAEHEITIAEGCSIEVVFDSPASLTTIWEKIGILQDLITFAAGRAAAILDVTVDGHPNVADRLTDDASIARGTLHASGRVSPGSGGRAMSAGEMTFTLGDLPFEQLIRAWFAHHEQYEAVIGTLLGQRYLPKQFAEPRLGMAVAALEELYRASGRKEIFMSSSARKRAQALVKKALQAVPEFAEYADRIALGVDNRITLDEKVRELLAELGDLVPLLFGNYLEPWITAIKKTRNEIAHSSVAKDLTEREVGRLAEATAAVIELILLKELGLDDEQLQTAAARRYDLVQRSLAEIFGGAVPSKTMAVASDPSLESSSQTAQAGLADEGGIEAATDDDLVDGDAPAAAHSEPVEPVDRTYAPPVAGDGEGHASVGAGGEGADSTSAVVERAAADAKGKAPLVARQPGGEMSEPGGLLG